MARITALFCLFCFLPHFAWATCLFDYNRLGPLIQNGNWDNVVQFIWSQSEQEGCGCDSEEKPCLRMGVKGSNILSVKNLLEGVAKLRKLDARMFSECSEMEQSDDSLRRKKLECYENTKNQFIKTNPELTAFVSEFMTERLLEKHTANIREYFTNKEKMKIKAKEDSLKNINEMRSKEIAMEICELLDAKKKLILRQKNMERHHKAIAAREYEIKRQLEYDIRATNEKIERLKREYRSINQQSFFIIDWCEKKKKNPLEF